MIFSAFLHQHWSLLGDSFLTHTLSEPLSPEAFSSFWFYLLSCTFHVCNFPTYGFTCLLSAVPASLPTARVKLHGLRDAVLITEVSLEHNTRPTETLSPPIIYLYVIVILLQLSQFPPHCSSLPCPHPRSHSQPPPCCLCPWVIHTCSLTSSFFFFPPLSPTPLPSGHC